MKKFSTPLIIIFLIVVFGFGFFIGQNSQPSIEKVQGLGNKELGQDTNIDFSLFWDAWHIIEKRYVDRSDLDRQKMVYGAIGGLVGSLDDPYTVFMEPKESKRFLDDISGSFEGIGAEIGIRKGITTVISPLEGNPAQKAGLKAGDKILEVDATSTIDLTLNKVVELIRGEKGTEVVLLIARDEWDKAKEIGIVRDTIQIPIIKWEMKDDNIAYIQLYHFTENSAFQFRKKAEEAMKAGAESIILDVRNNPGGYLETAVDIVSWFLPKGELVVIEDFGEDNGEKNNEFRSKGYKALENVPVVVLINEGSASASEILAGALRDIREIKIVGKKSFGKGSIQQLEKLRQGSIKITIAKWLTPSGISISDEGIVPDFEVEITEEDIEEMRDPQLDKAIEILNKKLK